MSESDQNTLSTVLSILRTTYKSIDIRAMLGRSRHDNSWYCILLKTRLTHEDITETREKHGKMSVCRIDNDRFKLVFDCRPIDTIDTFLNEIEQGQISIAGILARPIGDGHQTIRNNELINDPGFTEGDEKCGYAHKVAFTGMRSNPATTIQTLGITNSEIGTQLSDLTYCFNTTSNILNNQNNIIILLPIYCKRVRLLFEERGKYLAKYQMHRALMEQFKPRVRVSPNGEIRTFKHIEDIKPIDVVQDNNEMLMIALPMIKEIEQNDHIKIDTFHKSIQGIRVQDCFWASEIFKSKNSYLKNVIERIDPNLTKLESWLEGKGKDSSTDFEKAVAILLSLCGLRTIHVGDVYEGVAIQARRVLHKKTSVSIDIIALEEDDKIFILQCATDWNFRKIQDILDISHELAQIIIPDEVTVQPILVIGVETNKISSSKELAESRGVRIITIDQLRILLNKMRK